MRFFFPEGMPVPEFEIDTAAFWNACKEHKLKIQRCRRCKAYRHPPSAVCHECHSFEHEYVTSRGIGEVYTFTIIHHATIPLVAGLVPYNAVLVQLLDCGAAKILSNVVDVPNERIEIGMLLEVVWDDVSPTVSLPRFRRYVGSS